MPQRIQHLWELLNLDLLEWCKQGWPFIPFMLMTGEESDKRKMNKSRIIEIVAGALITTLLLGFLAMNQLLPVIEKNSKTLTTLAKEFHDFQLSVTDDRWKGSEQADYVKGHTNQHVREVGETRQNLLHHEDRGH